jgi:hypothetical protein
MSTQLNYSPEIARLFAELIVDHILPRYPVMAEKDIYTTIQWVRGSPIHHLLWCIGEVIWSALVEQQKRIWPNYDLAAVAVGEAQQWQDPHIAAVWNVSPMA